jgi:ring-1,2-phenylacetyl-CoA epoxidase subunit PaaB
MNPSYDPRVARLHVDNQKENEVVLQVGDNGIAYQVFHQKKRGDQHQHVGIVHAPNAEMALIFAKEQYGRRQKCVNMWVVASAAILAFSTEDDDMFSMATAPEKVYREAGGFKVMERINKYKAMQKANETI